MPKPITNGVVPGKEVRTTLPDLLASTHDKVRIVDISEYREAADALALCFKEDHVAKYFLFDNVTEPWTEATYAIHVQIMRYITYAHCSKGLVTTVGSNYDSVALWLVEFFSHHYTKPADHQNRMPPGGNMDDWLTIFKSGMWRLRYQLQPEGRKRFFNEFLPLLHTTKHDVMKEHDDNSWYLVYIGTKPEARGRGYARALIEMVTNQVCPTLKSSPCSGETLPVRPTVLYC